MPHAPFTSFVGVAKGNVSTYTTAAVSALATSVPVNGTVVPALSTIYIIDGALSESRAVTGGGGSGTLTVAALTNNHAIGTPIYWQLTAAIGPADYIPVTAFPDASDAISTVSDTGIRGSNVSEYGVYNVIGHSDIALAGDVIPDVFGYLLGSIFGSVDFTGGTPNQHAFAGMNTPASNGQPTELMFWVFNGAVTRLYVGVKLSDLTVTYDPLKLVSWTAKGQGFLSGVVATPTPSFTAIAPQQSWLGTMTIGGVFEPTLMTCAFTFKRAALDAIPTLDGNQSPYKIWAGALGATGTINSVYEGDADFLSNYLAGTQPILVMTLLTGTGAAQVGLKITASKCNFTSGWKASGSKGWVEMGGPISPVANTTDAGTLGTGYSPCKVTLYNSVVTGKYV